MILVIDANILFSALIKDSLTAELLFEENLKLYSPDFFTKKFLKYQNFILNKTLRSKEEFIQIMHMLNEIITVTPKKEYFEFMKEAEKISLDKKDVTYLALALKFNCGIWSNDKKLKELSKVKIYSTNDIRELLKKKLKN